MQNLAYSKVLRPVRPIKFRGSSRANLRGFPKEARREAGLQLFQVQLGEDPDDWKPIETIGPGAREIRIREKSGAFRVMYVAKFAQAIYVLHCFQKKTQKTAPSDLALAQRRYKELVREMSQ
jgi:phage-related protein